MNCFVVEHTATGKQVTTTDTLRAAMDTAESCRRNGSLFGGAKLLQFTIWETGSDHVVRRVLTLREDGSWVRDTAPSRHAASPSAAALASEEPEADVTVPAFPDHPDSRVMPGWLLPALPQHPFPIGME